MRRAAVILAIILPLVGAAPASAAAAQHRFRKIADSTTIPPGAVEPLKVFDELAFDGQHVAIRAQTASGVRGVYLWDGSALATIADTQSAVPSGGGVFTAFHSLALDAGRVAFVADGTQASGVYSNLGGPLRRVADTTTVMPSGVATFDTFTQTHGVAIDGSTIAFTGMGTGGAGPQEGVYVEAAGSLQRIADRTTPIPGAGQTFLFFKELDVSGGAVTFMGGRGTGGFNGNYTTPGAAPGSLRVVADANTAINGLVNPLSFFTPNSVRIDGDDLVFAAGDAPQNRGIFRDHAGLVTTVADKLTVDPLTGATFTALGSAYSLADGAVAFYGASTGPGGIYMHRDEALTNVIKAGDSLQGKLVSSLNLFANSLAGGRLAFAAKFNDGSSAAYLAEPLNLNPGPNGHTFLPAFDAQASGGLVQEGAARIDILHVDDSPGVDQRGVFEFDMSALPDGAQIQSAHLELDLTIVECTAVEGPTLTAYGYTGNGALEPGDAEQTAVTLGQSSMALELGRFEFALDGAGVQQLLAAGDMLGVVLRGDASARLLGLRTLENWDGHPALLTLTYSVPPSADFDGSGVVDGEDLQAWRAHFGDSDAEHAAGDADYDRDVDGADFLAWQRLLAAAPTAAAPEPSSAALWFGVTAIAFASRTISRRALRCVARCEA